MAVYGPLEKNSKDRFRLHYWLPYREFEKYDHQNVLSDIICEYQLPSNQLPSSQLPSILLQYQNKFHFFLISFKDGYEIFKDSTRILGLPPKTLLLRSFSPVFPTPRGVDTWGKKAKHSAAIQPPCGIHQRLVRFCPFV